MANPVLRFRLDPYLIEALEKSDLGKVLSPHLVAKTCVIGYLLDHKLVSKSELPKTLRGLSADILNELQENYGLENAQMYQALKDFLEF